MIKIAYDAGHGLNTAGKRTPDGEPEWTFNNKVARAFASELAKYQGVTMRRFDDSTGKHDVPLIERTDGANNWGADYYISFHHNAYESKWGDWTGVETYVYLGNKTTKSGKLAEAIHPAVVQAYGLKDRGIKEANYHILRETKMPAVLIEGGFMDSVIDIKKLRDDKVLENAGREVARALAKFLGLKKRGEVLEISKEEDLTMKQYEELKKLIDAQNKRIAELESQLGLKERAVSESHKVAWEWAKKCGIMNGRNPQRAVTREQLATVIYRLHNK
jgi:N-acetylmuramoyl-L-alanine amidase